MNWTGSQEKKTKHVTCLLPSLEALLPCCHSGSNRCHHAWRMSAHLEGHWKGHETHNSGQRASHIVLFKPEKVCYVYHEWYAPLDRKFELYTQFSWKDYLFLCTILNIRMVLEWTSYYGRRNEELETVILTPPPPSPTLPLGKLMSIFLFKVFYFLICVLLVFKFILNNILVVEKK